MKKPTVKKNWWQQNVRAVSVVATIVMAGVIVGGIAWAKGRPTGGGNSNLVYLSPSSGNYVSGSTITVAVRENSGTTPVSAVQAGFTYPSNLLQFVSIDSSSSAFTTDFSPATQATGSILLTRSSLTGQVSGDQLVANVTFQVLGSGRANLTMSTTCQPTSATANCTALSSAGSTITTSTADANYRLK